MLKNVDVALDYLYTRHLATKENRFLPKFSKAYVEEPYLRNFYAGLRPSSNEPIPSKPKLYQAPRPHIKNNKRLCPWKERNIRRYYCDSQAIPVRVNRKCRHQNKFKLHKNKVDFDSSDYEYNLSSDEEELFLKLKKYESQKSSGLNSDKKIDYPTIQKSLYFNDQFSDLNQYEINSHYKPLYYKEEEVSDSFSFSFSLSSEKEIKNQFSSSNYSFQNRKLFSTPEKELDIFNSEDQKELYDYIDKNIRIAKNYKNFESKKNNLDEKKSIYSNTHFSLNDSTQFIEDEDEALTHYQEQKLIARMFCRWMVAFYSKNS
ncbi:hypothetical protein TRFO_36815 [Tritrichomonas foetus]|uniref:Uncharacterized protein n=1 Tax=Tritrichomonas foetus TaxID=1144522 RepID=A0A1J4JD38_9EUKA|nr:hypothetical protein TRFO_36815 [Tritrichomonas foetus]|eukprot:OHS97032.1 hypothetical protein TRFO_36815 [Tritrichomonas foetus]